MPRTVFAASATAFSAALAKLSLDVPTTSITFCVSCGSPFDFDFFLWIVQLVCDCQRPRLRQFADPSSLRLSRIRRTIPLGMYAERFGLKPSDRSVRAAVLVREEPDEDEEEQHEDDDSQEDDNGHVNCIVVIAPTPATRPLSLIESYYVVPLALYAYITASSGGARMNPQNGIANPRMIGTNIEAHIGTLATRRMM